MTTTRTKHKTNKTARVQLSGVRVRFTAEMLDALRRLARFRHVSVGAIVNWLVSGNMPHVRELLAQHESELLKSAKARAWATMTSRDEAAETLKRLLHYLGEEYERLVDGAK